MNSLPFPLLLRFSFSEGEFQLLSFQLSIKLTVFCFHTLNLLHYFVELVATASAISGKHVAKLMENTINPEHVRKPGTRSSMEIESFSQLSDAEHVENTNFLHKIRLSFVLSEMCGHCYACGKPQVNIK